jgi:DNA-directed RNA polymerase specialized sigma24 family protein
MELAMGPEQDVGAARMEFDAFFLAQFERVARAAALVTGDAAAGQDLAQEAFTRLLERWSEISTDDHAKHSSTDSLGGSGRFSGLVP